MQKIEQQFELIELALRGEADGTEAVDALMDLKSKYFDLAQMAVKYLALAETEGVVNISKGIATLPYGSTLILLHGEK